MHAKVNPGKAETWTAKIFENRSSEVLIISENVQTANEMREQRMIPDDQPTITRNSIEIINIQTNLTNYVART